MTARFWIEALPKSRHQSLGADHFIQRGRAKPRRAGLYHQRHRRKLGPNIIS